MLHMTLNQLIFSLLTDLLM